MPILPRVTTWPASSTALRENAALQSFAMSMCTVQGAEQLRSPGRSLCSPGKAEAEALACTASAPTSSAIGLDFLSREERREDPHGLQGARQRGLWPDLSHLAVMNRCHRMRRRGWQTKHLGEASEIPMGSTRHFRAYDERWTSPSSALAYRAAVAVTTGGSSFLIRTKKHRGIFWDILAP